MAPELPTRLIAAATATIRAHVTELTDLDQAIGDGDHGINMQRGFDAVAAAPEIKTLPLGDALQKAGMTLVMTVGGASGPLFGSLLMAMGKSLGPAPADAAKLATMLADGIAAVQKRGKSEPGEKTMLDVLVPVAAALRNTPTAASTSTVLASLRAAADAGLEATRPIRATKGRASFLGERSVGHLDPGARSSQLLVHAVCDVVAGVTQ